MQWQASQNHQNSLSPVTEMSDIDSHDQVDTSLFVGQADCSDMSVIKEDIADESDAPPPVQKQATKAKTKTTGKAAGEHVHAVAVSKRKMEAENIEEVVLDSEGEAPQEPKLKKVKVKVWDAGRLYANCYKWNKDGSLCDFFKWTEGTPSSSPSSSLQPQQYTFICQPRQQTRWWPHVQKQDVVLHGYIPAVHTRCVISTVLLLEAAVWRAMLHPVQLHQQPEMKEKILNCHPCNHLHLHHIIQPALQWLVQQKMVLSTCSPTHDMISRWLPHLPSGDAGGLLHRMHEWDGISMMNC